ncbi:cytochrome p450 [Moniliophthora roreri MCA 2997]|uniref:Cytochrome p450 n=1 Tax=Moniliophthora roreri (strain MCA 2997) TaxID=1381753 RepID=V2WGF5_MONRO|nr:cytochrome p450 [Moniliophthora roreri MCA 2997]
MSILIPWQDNNLTLLVFLFLLAWLIQKTLKIGRREKYLPGGPPTVPILGNLHIFPIEDPHLKFTEWAQQYGDIYSLKISSSTFIVISGMEAVSELMDRRSATTADRPKYHMGKRVTNNLNMGLCGYSDTWRALRKAAHTILTPAAAESHLPIQRAEATQVLYDFIQNPDDFFNHIGRYTNSVIMSVLFGKRCPRYETPESLGFFESQELWNRCMSPTVVPPVDLLPFLDYIPESWAWWKQLASETRQKQRALYFGLLDECEQRMKRGEENGSYMEQILMEERELGLDREMIGYLGGILLEGGTETTASFLRCLVMALIVFPDVQRKAQAEIDGVVSRERMPTLSDIKDLPYIQALIKEVHRFHPVSPIVPHATLADEEYRGFVLPKGTTILVNTYGIYHNPQYFDNPEVLDPGRYLSHEFGVKEGVDASFFRDDLVFGYGRRACPGIYIARDSLNLNTMNLIWAFDFAPFKDAMGKEIPVSFDNHEKKGIVPVLLPFKCSIRPRSQNVVNIVEREFKEATETFVKFERDLVQADREWIKEGLHAMNSAGDSLNYKLGAQRSAPTHEMQFLPLEANPDSFDPLASSLGLDLSQYTIVDVPGLLFRNP